MLRRVIWQATGAPNFPPGDIIVQQCRHHALQTSPGPFWEGDWEGGKIGKDEVIILEICSRVFKNHQVFAVNVFSQFWCILEFLPRMLTLNMVKYLHSCKISVQLIDVCTDRGKTMFIIRMQGHIVSMSSMAGVTGTPNLVPYCASKVFPFLLWLDCPLLKCGFPAALNFPIASLHWGGWWRPSILNSGQTSQIQRCRWLH